MIKSYRKVEDHFSYTSKCRGATHSICNFKLSIPKEICIIFHNGWNYGYHFIKRNLTKEFQEKFNCQGENTEKSKTFLVSIQKKLKGLLNREKKLQKPYLTN